MSDVYKFLLESHPASNQAKTHSFLSKITSRCKPKPAAVNTNSNSESELRQYVNHFDYSIGARNDEDIDPLQYYQVFNGNYPRVEMLAKHLLVIAGTSVPFECLFSHAGLINTHLRNRLSPNTLLF